LYKIAKKHAIKGIHSIYVFIGSNHDETCYFSECFFTLIIAILLSSTSINLIFYRS